MHRTRNLFATLVYVICVPAGIAQIPGNALGELRWRCIGPYRAGWTTAVAGIPSQPTVFYMGTAGGGMWKTNDAGLTWMPLMEREATSSIGALAVSLSNPNIVYAGTGQVTTRYDIIDGNGVYRSDNAGKTWRHLGLERTRHIGALLIDPENPDRVLVAAMGQAFASNRERGIYLTTNGGKEWKRVLFVNEETGAVDLAWDWKNTTVVYAATWQMRQHPWLDYFQPQVGPGSGMYKSTDGGEHWSKVVSNDLPRGPLGRIGLGVAQGSEGSNVFATIIAPVGKSGLYRSSDYGASWKLVNSEGALTNPYFSRIIPAPDSRDVLYVMGRSIHRSGDGGSHFEIIKGAPGGDDYHCLWINPAHTSFMITGADQGAAVTVNAGETWSAWYNQPTGQFYHLATDDQFPYRIYSGQQDNGTISIASRGATGVIEERDWRPTGGEERGYEIPKPGNPNIVMGTGLGGTLTRANQRTRQVANVSPHPLSSYAARPSTVRYRYTWITPLEYSPIGKHYLYFGAQVLFRSSDDGDHWEEVSPDLSGKKTNTKECENPNAVAARDCGFGTIFSIAPSQMRESVVWVGTDDGLVQLTTDGCKSWRNVSPKNVPSFGLISSISASRFSEHGAYVAVDLHRLGSSTPLILKTKDDGKTWKTIVNGIPADEHTFVVRADPVRDGLLYAGTNRGVHVSFDDGEHWQSLSLNLPTTCVRDLLVHDNDLIVATQGRGIWILDDVSPLRQLSNEILSKPVHLFQPAIAWRVRGNLNNDTPPPSSTPLGENPPDGVAIDYWLKGKMTAEITISIVDSMNNFVKGFSSETALTPPTANQYFQSEWLGESKGLSKEAGSHRFVWNLRSERPKSMKYDYTIAGVWNKGTPVEPDGALILPGKYTIQFSLIRSKDSVITVMQNFIVNPDPRVKVDQEELDEQMKFTHTVDGAMGGAVMLNQQVSASLEIQKNAQKREGGRSSWIIDTLTAIKDSASPNLQSIGEALTDIAVALRSYDGLPTEGMRQAFTEYNDRLQALWKRWQAVHSRISGKR